MSDGTQTSDVPDLAEQCARLQREAGALAVLVVGEDGELLGHSGGAGALSDAVLDTVGDLTAELLSRGAQPEAAEPGDLVAEIVSMHVCSTAIGSKATLHVVFDASTKLATVRQRMKRAREMIQRSLDAR